MSEKANILITGASGFIGGHIVRYFADKGINIYCLVRENSNKNFIKDLPVHFLKGDITNYTGLVKAFENMDFIIHTAAISKDWGSWDSFYGVNVNGTINVLKAARENNIKNIIITGSVSSYGEEDSETLKDENSPDESHYSYFMDSMIPSGMNYYRDSKRIATQEASSYALENNLNLTIIEPVWVYGENEFSSGFYEYLKTLKSGMRIMPGSKKNNYHVIYAGDLAKAYYHAFEKQLAGVNRVIIANKNPENMYRIFGLFCREAGLKQPLTISRPLIYPIAFLWELGACLINSRKAPLLSRARINMFYDNIGFKTEKARSLLSFIAETSLESGISKTVKWYKQHQYL